MVKVEMFVLEKGKRKTVWAIDHNFFQTPREQVTYGNASFEIILLVTLLHVCMQEPCTDDLSTRRVNPLRFPSKRCTEKH